MVLGGTNVKVLLSAPMSDHENVICPVHRELDGRYRIAKARWAQLAYKENGIFGEPVPPRPAASLRTSSARRPNYPKECSLIANGAHTFSLKPNDNRPVYDGMLRAR